MLTNGSHAATSVARDDHGSSTPEINTLHDAYSVSGSSPPAGKPSKPDRAHDHDRLPRLAYTPEEAAHVIGVSRSLFYERVLPHLKTVRLGRKRIIATSELELFLARHASRALP
jgi:hypothetical protein